MNPPYRIKTVVTDPLAGTSLEDAKAELVRAALDHGRAELMFNGVLRVVTRAKLIDAVQEIHPGSGARGAGAGALKPVNPQYVDGT